MHLVPEMRSAEKESWYFLFLGNTDEYSKQIYELKPIKFCLGFNELGKVKLVQFTDYLYMSQA